VACGGEEDIVRVSLCGDPEAEAASEAKAISLISSPSYPGEVLLEDDGEHSVAAFLWQASARKHCMELVLALVSSVRGPLNSVLRNMAHANIVFMTQKKEASFMCFMCFMCLCVYVFYVFSQRRRQRYHRNPYRGFLRSAV
jgi:hypothetical protein